MPNPQGGSLGFEISDDTKLVETILTYISENERYLVKDPEVRWVIFNLVKGKIIKKDQNLILKIGNILVSSNRKARLFARIYGGAMIGFVCGVFASIPYFMLMVRLYFDAIENCDFKCHGYFEHLPKEGLVTIYADKPTGQQAIAENNDARQVEIYTPSKTSDSELISKTGEIKKTRGYTKSRIKHKQVNFSDFRNTDPVLSAFKDLEEPNVPQNVC